MKNKTIYYACMAVAMMTAGQASAQDLTGLAEYRYNDATQLWLNTQNAAALSLDSARTRWTASAQYMHTEGDMHRTQEGRLHNGLNLQTESYLQLSDLLYGYGKVGFGMGELKNRAYADAMRPYNSNPYYTGSATGNPWDFQDIDITAALGTKALGHWRLGMRLDYNLGDLSGLRDPRGRNRMLEYRLTPAATYTVGQHSVGLDMHYGRRKEKISNVSTVATSTPNFPYYFFEGVDQATVSVQGYTGYQREWVEHNWGGNLSYGYKADGLQSVNTLGMAQGTEYVWGQYKQSPGKYTRYTFDFSSHNAIKSGDLLHEVTLGAGYEQAYADEYLQQVKTWTDAETGVQSTAYETIIEYRKRYQVKLFDANWGYRLNWLDGEAVSSYVGLKGDVQTSSNKHLMPETSAKYGRMNWTLEGGKSWLGKQLLVDGAVTMSTSLKNDLLLTDPTTAVAQGILLPDQPFYAANYVRLSLSATYQFAVSLKGQRNMCYVKAFGDYARSHNHLDQKAIGVGIGIVR